MLALAFFLLTASPQDTQRALDATHTEQRVAQLRAAGDYRAALAELDGWLRRWSGGGAYVDATALAAQLVHMRGLRTAVAQLDELKARASNDPVAARRLVAGIVPRAEPLPRTLEQVRALEQLALQDDAVHAVLGEAFPAALTVVPAGEGRGERVDVDVLTTTLGNALVDVSRHALPLVVEGGVGSLTVTVSIDETRSAHALIEGTKMRSYGVVMTAVLVDATGIEVAKAATTTQVLGISAATAARQGTTRCAQQLYALVVEQVAKRAVP